MDFGGKAEEIREGGTESGKRKGREVKFLF